MDGKELWLPLANLVSICALLVWFPDNPDDTITRLLFPGSTPQNKVLRGLEKLKELEFMQKPVCASRSIRQPAPVAPASQTEKKEAMKAMAAAGLSHRMTSSRSSSGRTAAATASATEKSDISSKKMSSSRSERVNVKRPTPRTSAASAASEAVSSGPRSPKRKPEDKAQKERRNQAAGKMKMSFGIGGKIKEMQFYRSTNQGFGAQKREAFDFTLYYGNFRQVRAYKEAPSASSLKQQIS